MEPQFSFGVIADVQYADNDNCYNFSQTNMRYYRNALPSLRNAVDHWMKDKRNISFVVQLGDVIDGCNTKNGGKAESWRVLSLVMDELDQFPGPVHHLIGNHELYNFTRDELCESKLFSVVNGFMSTQNYNCAREDDSRKKFYYHFSPFEGYRFVIMDSYDVAMLGWGEDCSVTQQSREILTSVNFNKELNSPVGLKGNDRRFVEFNGAIGERQRQWLKEVLQSAENDNEKVMIFGHIPFYPHKKDQMCLLWDYELVLEILHKFSCVVATFAGHLHRTRYTLDANIHHICIPAVVETPPGSDAFGTIDVYANRIILNGHGSVESEEFIYRQNVLAQEVAVGSVATKKELADHSI
ncbi:manganese-dependent ADP-ribose/CDP-alcohol diphosphatase-like [Anneissia japonica]|uniref:manganese-dependent ADP-ribose/CDP-alcohol diphosphatase-like n=1 Tax=Anneissia japonica TaxID=1529436 RepID=UPI0014259985|nr:manganese-dependent ADP-ribose/CDP-alcohol diphosphatase-like [Anneissia japonica]